MGIKTKVLGFLGLGGADGTQPQSIDVFLGELGTMLGYDVEFERQDQEDGSIIFNVKGAEIDTFLNGSSEILDALTHVAMRVQRRIQGLSNASPGEEDSLTRVRFDSEGFRERRRRELVELAKRLRTIVVESRKATYVNALGPADRKIIHTTIPTRDILTLGYHKTTPRYLSPRHVQSVRPIQRDFHKVF